MIVIGNAPLNRGCASACSPHSSAGPDAASAAPARSTVRRSISLSPAVDWLAISPPWRFGTRAPQFNEDCGLPLAPVKGTVLRTPAGSQPGLPERSGNGGAARKLSFRVSDRFRRITIIRRDRPRGLKMPHNRRSVLCMRAAQLDEPALQDALQRLVDSGLVFQRGVPPSAEYLFKHALVQDTAYSTLLRGPRQALHRRIAEALEQRL